jgi:hypothetical protein
MQQLVGRENHRPFLQMSDVDHVEQHVGSIRSVGQIALSFAKSLCPTLEGFLPAWRKLFGLGLQADSSTVENARRERGPRIGPVTRKRVRFSEE